MQKFRGELQNVPRDASQVSCSTNLRLNRVERLSVSDGPVRDTLTLNNPEVNLVQHTGRSLKAIMCVDSLERQAFFK